MTYLFYDLIVAAVLLLLVMKGKKRGFVLTLCGLLAVFVAFFGAALLSDLMCEPVGRLVQPVVEDSVSRVLTQAVQDVNNSLTLQQVLTALEGSSLYQAFAPGLAGAVDRGLLEVTSTAAAAVAAYIAREIARVVLFVVAFVVVLLAWNLLARALDLAFHLPVLSTVNALMGAAAGLAEGVVLVFIAVWLLEENFIPRAAVEHTYLLRFFCENSPFDLIAMILKG